MALHEAFQVLFGGRVYYPPIHPRNTFSFALNGNHHDPFLALVAANCVFILSADEGFVYVHFAFHGKIPAALHGFHHLLFEQPAGLLAQLQLAAKLGAADAVSAGGDVVDDVEGLQKGELAAVEERVGQGRLHIAAAGALPVEGAVAGAVLAVPALGAAVTALPFQGGQILPTPVRVGESGLEFKQAQALESFLHTNS